MPIQATIYFAPLGKKEIHTITDVNDDDAEWFAKHNVKLSIEQLRNGERVIYADYGLRDADDQPVEAMAISATASCRDMLYHLRTEVEKLL